MINKIWNGNTNRQDFYRGLSSDRFIPKTLIKCLIWTFILQL